MDEELRTVDEKGLALVIERLASGIGVQAKDLARRLTGDLRSFWAIEQGENNLGILRAHAAANLRKSFDEIPPKSPSLSDAYTGSLKAAFNVLSDEEVNGDGIQKFVENHIHAQDRHNWARDKYNVSLKTPQNYVKDASKKIAEMLVRGTYVAVAPEEFEKYGVHPPDQKIRNEDGARWKHRLSDNRKLSVTLTVLIIGLGTGGFFGIKAILVDSPSGSPSQPVSASMASGPVHVDSVAYERDGSGKSVGWSYVLPQRTQMSTTDLAALNSLGGSGQAYQSWMEGKGAVVPDDASIQLALRNKTNQSITIENIEVVKQCRQPLSGTLFYSPQQGPQGDVYLTFDLDDRFPVAKDGGTGASYFGGSAAHTVQLSPDEVSTLLIDTTTERQSCTFRFNLMIDPGDGGSPVSEAVDDNGKPFTVTAVPTSDQEPKFSYYQQVYAADGAPDGSGFAAVNPVTYGGG